MTSRTATSGVEVKNGYTYIFLHSLLRLHGVVTYYDKANTYYIYRYTLSTMTSLVV